MSMQQNQRSLRYKMASTGMILFVLFFIGVAFLGVGIGSYITTINYQKNGIQVEAVIEQIDYHTAEDSSPTVYVSYVVNGTPYYTSLNSYSSSWYEGKQLELYCRKDHPEKVIPLTMLKVFTYVFGGVGVGILIAAICVVIGYEKNKKLAKLKEEGISIYCKIDAIHENKNMTVNGIHPFVIYCSNGSQTFKSKNIYENLYDVQAGDSVYVYVDQDNVNRFYIDYQSIEHQSIHSEIDESKKYATENDKS